jgi:putative nucleotidyltransferase with HDIG domain
MRSLLPCDALSFTLIAPNDAHKATTYVRGGLEGEKVVKMTTSLTFQTTEALVNNPDGLAIDNAHGWPGHLAGSPEMKSFLLVPILLKGKLSGIINLGYLLPKVHRLEELLQARQVADQVSVALSNARLVEELEQLNLGTLTALARAIDAKSPWTAGHSERVTKLAVEIGRVLGLGPHELQILHRGGLVHDIGKLGTPPDILDKAGKLTDRELQMMREHVRLGARILEPIPSLAEVIPIVLEHHEWYDGSGYPEGLAGEQISLHGRIFAVADCFDALASDRPYRAGISRERVIEMIQEGAGRQYDPKIVQAFLKVMAQQERDSFHIKVPAA